MAAQRNADLTRTWLVKNKSDGSPVDLTGASLKMQFKNKRGAAYALEASTDNGLLTIFTGGQVTLSVPWATAKNIPPANYEYDAIQEVSSTSRKFLWRGVLPIFPGLTDDGTPFLAPPSGSASDETIIVDDNASITVVQSGIDTGALLSEIAAAEATTLAARDEAVAAAADADAARDTSVANASATGADAGNTSRYMVAAQVAEAAAELAAAAAQAGTTVYVDEPTGRAAVADGASFYVQGATSADGLSLYRRVNSSSSTLLGTFPSFGAVTALTNRVAAIEPVTDAVSAFLNPWFGKIPLWMYRDATTGALKFDTYLAVQSDGTFALVSPQTQRLDVIERGGSGIPRTLLSPVLSGDTQQGANGGFFGGVRNGFVESGPVPTSDYGYDVQGAVGARKIYISKAGGGTPFSITGDLPGDNYGVRSYSNGIRWHNSNGGIITPQSFFWTNGFDPASSGVLSSSVQTLWAILGTGQSTVVGIQSFDLSARTLLSSTSPLLGYMQMFGKMALGRRESPRLLGHNHGGTPQQFDILDPLHLHTLIPAAESVVAQSGETQLTQMAYEFLTRMGSTHAAVIGDVGIGSMPYESIGPGSPAYPASAGTIPFQNGLKFIKRVREIAKMNGLAFGGVIVFWPQQEGNSAEALTTFYNKIIAHQAAYAAFVAKITADDGATPPVFMVMNAFTNGPIENLSSTEEGLAQVKAATDDATKATFGVCAPCSLFTRDPGDGAHFDKDGGPFNGAFAGRNAYRLVKGLDARPLHATAANISGSTITFPMHLPLGAVALTGTSPYVTDPGNLGITLKRQDNGIAVGITSASISGTNLVVVANAPPSGVACEAEWCMDGTPGTHGGPTTGCRSPINDGNTDTSIYSKQMANHLVPQRFQNLIF